MPTDPTPFLATVVGTSVTLAAIVGGLLVARFVTIDSDQQTSRKVLADARERLDTARVREATAWQAILDRDANDFFQSGRIAKAIAGGTTAPQDLMRVEDWEHSEDALRPYAEQAVKEYRAALDLLPTLPIQAGEFWDDFRRRTDRLPPINGRGFGSTYSTTSSCSDAPPRKRRRERLLERGRLWGSIRSLPRTA